MWQAPKLAAHYLCQRFYQEMAAAPASPALAFARAQSWLRTVTQGELDQLPEPASFRRLVINPGPAQLARKPFTHPDAWAAFAYYGV